MTAAGEVSTVPASAPKAGRSGLDWVPVGLALVAEAAWLAVIGALLQAIVLLPPSPGLPELVAAGALGATAARRLGPRLGDRWPGTAVVLATLTGIAGWLLAPDVRSILVEQGIRGLGPALAANPGGWLLWPAFVRGMAYARLPVETGRIGVLIVVGVPVISLCAAVGGMISEPTRGLFLDAVRIDAVVFLVTAIPALALARVAGQAPWAELDWRRNPTWLALALALLGVTVATALLSAAVAGQAIAMAVASLLVPLLAVGFIIGFDRRSLRILALSLLAAGALGVFLGLFEDQGGGGNGAGNVVPAVPQEPAAQTGLAIGLLVVILAGAVVVVALLARLWLRRPSGSVARDDEIREIARDSEVDRARTGRRRRLGRRRAPTDAVAAYRSLLEDLDGLPLVGREAGETPAEHARRLRAAGAGSLELELLAADYGLARYGDVPLTAAEHRRALGRALVLRRRLTAASRTAGAAAHAAAGTAAGGGSAAASSGPVQRGSGSRGEVGADLPDIELPGVAATLLNLIRRGH